MKLEIWVEKDSSTIIDKTVFLKNNQKSYNQICAKA